MLESTRQGKEGDFLYKERTDQWPVIQVAPGPYRRCALCLDKDFWTPDVSADPNR